MKETSKKQMKEFREHYDSFKTTNFHSKASTGWVSITFILLVESTEYSNLQVNRPLFKLSLVALISKFNWLLLSTKQ